MRQSLRHKPLDHTFWDPSLALPLIEPAAPIAAALRTIWRVLRDACVAHRTYEDLRFRRVPHDTALRQALGASKPRK
jgi:hypothetical protein